MARHLAPIGKTVFRVLEELTTTTESGESKHSYGYGPYMTKGAAKSQRTRLQREHEDYRRMGSQKLTLQTATIDWKDVDE
ncbi:hypothetical protein ARTSIC4J27_612 [Pseudarthrobacter siccitolerans]|uniref:Uncharacterized protein n=1 Tax=Pseudarthrobacter siccitolerans TaxID=861266 RepID=A0A024GY29_9MICC|nr:hypothetical protein [Pseudarthrobacter siccitolerans]CCQ44683.1 hypothetical protein ARTSIC4J27_612 [Pseudarthrobacter siccitolerans]